MSLSMPRPSFAPRIVAIALLSSLALVLAGCASTAPTGDVAVAPAAASAEAIVSAIRAAGRADDRELAVQPLRDAMVEDLREQAAALEGERKYAEAAQALDRALAITPEDPAVLQERAEAAVLLGDLPGAEQRARQAFELGSKVGPLCRRHWATVRAARYAANDGAGARDAGTRLAACKVPPPDRF